MKTKKILLDNLIYQKCYPQIGLIILLLLMILFLKIFLRIAISNKYVFLNIIKTRPNIDDKYSN